MAKGNGRKTRTVTRRKAEPITIEEADRRLGLSTVAVYTAIVEHDMDYLWHLMVPDMVSVLEARRATQDKEEGKNPEIPSRLNFLRQHTYGLVKEHYKASAYPLGTKAEDVQAPVVMAYETGERSPAFDSAITTAGWCAMLWFDGHLHVQTKQNARGKNHLWVPWKEVQPTVRLDGKNDVQNTSDQPYEITQRFMQEMYRRIYLTPAEAAGTKPTASETVATRIANIFQGATDENKDEVTEDLAKVADALPEDATIISMENHIGKYCGMLSTAIREIPVKEYTPEDVEALEALHSDVTEALSKLNARPARGRVRAKGQGRLRAVNE